MMNALKISACLAAAGILSGCVVGERFEGTERYRGASSIIATGQDQGIDTGVLNNGRGAIAYDPDGCQQYIIDDGLEGYATNRSDPVSGLPICNNLYPPGTVIREYQSTTEGIQDRVSGPGRRTVVVRR
ncbi:hypothetical protein SAMN05216227_1009129 [Pseudorhodobacter antarcticus]|jgi:hypothetical protein|uniref:Lipoprotein n=1 Tax=Pseudorhodobacter antarcticus TaxID=1077947 RepID=A0A1H8EXI3_9RHOB|nr:hypothetical protein [Pseudorhodobacter antarcticus]SEN23597.1 hypothetical protein SAMN05216227_1009129 [Pseudorhodobacter antarcticus]